MRPEFYSNYKGLVKGIRYIANKSGETIKGTPVESWDDEMETVSKKKQEKSRENITEHARIVHTQVELLLNNIIKEVSKRKSEFDF